MFLRVSTYFYAFNLSFYTLSYLLSFYVRILSQLAFDLSLIFFLEFLLSFYSIYILFS
jgi:hypothetical protein